MFTPDPDIVLNIVVILAIIVAVIISSDEE